MPRIGLSRIVLVLTLVAVVANTGSGAGVEPSQLYKGRSVPAWIAAVKLPSGRFSTEAIRVLGELGPDARGAVPVLIEALADSKATWVAMDTLSSIGHDAKDAVPALIACLRKTQGFESSGLCHTLARIGEPAVPALKAAMHETGPVSAYAADALGDMGDIGMKVLIAALNDRCPSVRRNAARTMACMNPGAVEALDALIKALSDDHEDVRHAAADALGVIGADAKSAVPELRRALKDDAPEARAAAINALGLIGVDAKPAIPDLIEALNDKSRVVRAAALDALGSVGRGGDGARHAMTRFIRKDQAWDLRGRAICTLGRVGGDPAPLVELLKDDDKSIQWSAASALAEFHPGLAAPVFRQGLNDPDRQYSATAALGRIGKAAVAVLTDALRDRDEEVRCIASQLLRDVGPAARVAVPALVEALEDESPAVRLAAGDALSKIDSANKAAVATLLALLTGKGLGPVKTYRDIYQRFDAAKAMGRFGPSVTPSVVDTLKSADEWTRAAALCALGDAEPGAKATVAVLVNHLADKSAEVRRCAVLILVGSGTAAVEAVGPLTAALRDNNSEVRAGAALALGRIGLPAHRAVPALIAVLEEPYAPGPRWFSHPEFVSWGDHPVARLRGSAAYALGRIGKDAREATPALVVALRDDYPQVRQAAAWALARVAPDPKISVRPLAGALLDDTWSGTAPCAALALGEMGPEARDAVSALADALRYGSPDLKGCAAWALGQIGPEAKPAVPALLCFLSTPEPWSRRVDHGHQTSYVNPQLPPWGPAVPQFLELMKCDDRDARSEAAGALTQIERAAARVR